MEASIQDLIRLYPTSFLSRKLECKLSVSKVDVVSFSILLFKLSRAQKFEGLYFADHPAQSSLPSGLTLSPDEFELLPPRSQTAEESSRQRLCSIFRFSVPYLSTGLSHSTNEGVGATEHPHPRRECIYFCGNSLGLQPKLTKTLVQAELDIWATRGVQGHFRHDKWPWVSIHETCTAGMAEIVGAKVEEVAIMGSLTANLHLLMAAFYSPTLQKHKIIIESRAFPSDHVWDFHVAILIAVRR